MTQDATPEGLIEVTQADRDAAAAFYGPHLSRPGEVLVTAHMRAGKIDESPLIQAFAHHRIEASAARPDHPDSRSRGEALRDFLVSWLDANGEAGKARFIAEGGVCTSLYVNDILALLSSFRDRLASATPSPAAPIAPLDREVVARIIDPFAFKAHEAMRSYGLGQGDSEEEALATADWAHKLPCDEALAKADAILKLLPVEKGEGS